MARNTASLGQQSTFTPSDFCTAPSAPRVGRAAGAPRTAASTGAAVAVADAVQTGPVAGKIESSPRLGGMASVSAGVGDGGALDDLDYGEDSRAEVDMNVVMSEDGRFIEVQGTGERTPFSRERLDSLLDLASGGITELLGVQAAVVDGGLLTYGR